MLVLNMKKLKVANPEMLGQPAIELGLRERLPGPESLIFPLYVKYGQIWTKFSESANTL